MNTARLQVIEEYLANERVLGCQTPSCPVADCVARRRLRGFVEELGVALQAANREIGQLRGDARAAISDAVEQFRLDDGQGAQ